jgi:hypothetical protein
MGIAAAESSDEARRRIENLIRGGARCASSREDMDDLDEMNRSNDTLDWRSISPGQQPRAWEEFRRYGFGELRAPFRSAEFSIDRLI